MEKINKKNNKQKNIQRGEQEEKRNILKENNLYASKNLYKNLVKLKNFENYDIIASFISIKSEISTKYLNKFIMENKKLLCLPIIKNNYEILLFKKYDTFTKLVPGKFGTLEPNHSSKNMLPNIILTPCLAFDMKGFRLGYGGGYYDKTFSYLKKIKHKYISVAVAFEGQKVNNVVHDALDRKIHYILTEKELYKI